jgi:hypothetical protein
VLVGASLAGMDGGDVSGKARIGTSCQFEKFNFLISMPVDGTSRNALGNSRSGFPAKSLSTREWPTAVSMYLALP